jgi:uncharacterized protein YbjT (DUF2867 family)
MNVLVTGITGFIGSRLALRLGQDGHAVRGYARDPHRAAPGIPVVAGDAVAGTGLEQALEGIDVAYFLIHSMEPATETAFPAREQAAARRFAAAARAAGVRRIVYLGGLMPTGGPASDHLASRMEVEQILLDDAPC